MIKSKKNKQTTGQTMVYTTQKTNDWATRTPPTTGGVIKWSGRVNSSCSSSGTRQSYISSLTVIWTATLAIMHSLSMLIWLINFGQIIDKLH